MKKVSALLITIFFTLNSQFVFSATKDNPEFFAPEVGLPAPDNPAPLKPPMLPPDNPQGITDEIEKTIKIHNKREEKINRLNKYSQ